MKKSNINFNLYKTFAEVYETKNLSAAAVKLDLTQPTVTYNIKELERQLKVRLFNSNSRGVEPTSYADELYPFIKTAFNSLLGAEGAIKEFNEKSGGTIRISVSMYYISQITGTFIAKFNKQYPNIKFEVKTTSMNSAMDALVRHETDVVIYAYTTKPQDSDQLETTSLTEITNYIFTSSEFAKANNLGTSITKDQLKKLPILSLSKDFQIRKELEKLGLSQHPVIEVNSTDMISDLIEKNVGVTIGPSNFIDSNKNFVKLEVTDLQLPKCYLALRNNKHLTNKAAMAFIEQIKNEQN